MSIQTAKDEYSQALKLGEKEYNELTAAGKPSNPEVLDELLPEIDSMTVRDIGTLEIPAERIVGTKTAGRYAAFTPSFLPLMDASSEFATKWVALCEAHLGDVGIREPILCYEYLGNFYVQEGNKRVSVLRYFGASRIPAVVRRVMPPLTEEPRIQAYYEFLEFFRVSRLYSVQFRRPKDYDKLLAFLRKEPGESWTEEERRIFNARLHYFRDALAAVNTKKEDILPEEALLFWLQLYPYEDLSRLTTAELKKSVAELWDDIRALSTESVRVETQAPPDVKPNLITRIISSGRDHLNVAFVHQLAPETSVWAQSHEQGKKDLVESLGEKVTVRSYYNANSPEEIEAMIDQAVADGAQAVFTTVPRMSRAALKAAVKYPKVFVFNCSVDQPYSSIRTYYGRIYEAKFIAGAIAGAMAQNDRIGYIASYPIYGVPASINAFALGAQLTNPRAQIELSWSCVEGTSQADFLANGIRVISNRESPVQSKTFMDFSSYGTYLMDDRGGLIPLASPVWVWGKFYIMAVKGILSGSLKNEKSSEALNYWLGMDTGLIDIDISQKVPEGVRILASLLEREIIEKKLDPFARKIVAQDGSVKNPGAGAGFSLDELLHMDWLCENVIGEIPGFSEIRPESQAMVRELGIYRNTIPAQKEGKTNEDISALR